MSLQRAKATTPATLIEASPPVSQPYKSQSYWSIAFSSLRRDKLTIIALAFILTLALLALLAPLLSNLLVGAVADFPLRGLSQLAAGRRAADGLPG